MGVSFAWCDQRAKLMTNLARFVGKIIDFSVPLVVITLSCASINATNNSNFLGNNKSLEMKITAVDAMYGVLASLALQIADPRPNNNRDGVDTKQLLRLPWLLVTLERMLTNEAPTLLRIGRTVMNSKGAPATALVLAAVAVYGK